MKPRMTDVVLPPTFEQTASFTPGPWKYIPSHIAEGPSEVRHADGWLICCTCSDEFARLIAAAPGLLAALTECHGRLKMGLDEIIHLRGWLSASELAERKVQDKAADEADRQAIDRAAAAIAKAKAGAL